MPDKQNENKFMAMLERRGIVRKADSEERSTDASPGDMRERQEAELRSMLGPPTAETTNVTPAAKQPVPGMINPVLPGEKPQPVERELPRTVILANIEPPRPVVREEVEPQRPPVERVEPEPEWPPVERVKPEPEWPPVERVGPEPQWPPVERVEPEPQRPPVEHVEPEPPLVADLAQPIPYFSETDTFKEDMSMTDEPVVAPVASVAYERPPEPPIENYTERYLDIDELYEALSLKFQRTDTIYLIEEYLNTLPESLPDESRREIVNKIVAASGFDFDILMGDGVLRVKMLKEYAEKFARHTDNYVSARHAELDDLEQQIMRIRRQIENRRELHKKQFFAIEAEAQRLKDILTFING